MSCLVEVNHPTLLKESKAILKNMANALSIDITRFIAERKDELAKIFLDKEDFELMHFNTLTTLLTILPDELLIIFMNYLRDSLRNESLVNVTSDEIGVLNTPEGEVYNQKVYESAKVGEQKQVNVKRESKAYSYKEQKIEMELREELKKKDNNKQQQKHPELTQKQKEQLQIIISEEKETRNRLKKLEKLLAKDSMILNACIGTDPSHLKFYYLDLMAMLLRLGTSLLAAPFVIPPYLKLSQCIFKGENKYIGKFCSFLVFLFTPYEGGLVRFLRFIKKVTVSVFEVVHGRSFQLYFL